MMAEMLLVGLGANLPDRYGHEPVTTCAWAVDKIGNIPGLRLEGVSRWYRTRPVPASDQPDYVNGVARLSGAIAPEALLERLHAIEAQAGRVRSVRNAARVLDLDLLAVDGLVRDGPGLILPHPRLAERAFVLYPLCDVAPEWRHPVLGRTARALRDAAGPQGIAVLE